MDFLTKLILLFNKNLDSRNPRIKAIKSRIFMAGLILAVGLVLVLGVIQVNFATEHLFLLILLAIAFLMVILLTSFLKVKSSLERVAAFLFLGLLFIFFMLATNSGASETFKKSLVALGVMPDKSVELSLHFFADSAQEQRIEWGAVRVELASLGFLANVQDGGIKVPILESQRGDTLTLQPDIPEIPKKKIRIAIPRERNQLDVILVPVRYRTLVKGYILTRNHELFGEIKEINWGGKKLQIKEDRSYSVELPYKAGIPQKMVSIFNDGRLIIRNNEVIPSGVSHEIAI